MQDPAPLDTLVAIALAAGKAIMTIYDGNANVREKADGSEVTDADEAAEAIILEQLAAVDPRPVIAEEAVAAGHVPEVAESFYLVDPLDGTREFISRNGEFTVNIARIEGGVPVAGVVYAPAIGALFAGDETGAWRATVTDGVVGERHAIGCADTPEAMRVVASRSHLTDETKAFCDRFEVASFVSSGSSLKFCRLAEGAADLYPRMGRTMEWDTAAGHAVLRAAGGRVLTTEGAPLTYGKKTHPSGAFANPHFVAAGPFDPFAIAR
ncbi:MAG: 3'(2'),5'-bisphosphate nucleotidase CysQ [Pseudomonadota bacterium]